MDSGEIINIVVGAIGTIVALWGSYYLNKKANEARRELDELKKKQNEHSN